MHAFDETAIRKLGSLDLEEREQAWVQLYAQDQVYQRVEKAAAGRVSAFADEDEDVTDAPRQWVGYAVQKARQYLTRFRDPGDAEACAQDAWAGLFRRLQTQPLVLADPVEPTFKAFLTRCVRNACIDDWRRRHEGPGIVALLQHVQQRVSTDGERLWVQEMINLAREGRAWDDVEELAQRLGVDRPDVDEFLCQVVDPILVRVLRMHEEPAPSATPEPERHQLVVAVLDRIRDLLEAAGQGRERVRRAEGAASQPVNREDDERKASTVVLAIVRMRITGGGWRGSRVDHRALLTELEAMGRPWKSEGCEDSHTPGLPEVWTCQRCRNALSKQVERANDRVDEIREDPIVRELVQALESGRVPARRSPPRRDGDPQPDQGRQP